MLDMTRDTVKLVLANKLFADQISAFRQVAIGAVGTAILLVAFAAAVPLPFWLSATFVGFLGGFAMPYLFKDVKFQ